MCEFLIPTKIRISKIPHAGTGRFFVHNHKKGTIIRKQIIDSPCLHVIKDNSGLKKYDIELLKHFGHTKPIHSNITTNYVYLNFPPMNTNHSIYNNIDFEYNDTEKITYVTRDVYAGEEIYQNYCNFDKCDWFEEFLHDHSILSARELGDLIK